MYSIKRNKNTIEILPAIVYRLANRVLILKLKNVFKKIMPKERR